MPVNVSLKTPVWGLLLWITLFGRALTLFVTVNVTNIDYRTVSGGFMRVLRRSVLLNELASSYTHGLPGNPHCTMKANDAEVDNKALT